MKKKTTTTRYDVAEHLRTPVEMAAYLEACFEEADGDAAFVALGAVPCVRLPVHVPRHDTSRSEHT